jgi:gas vesicle protein
MGAAQRLLKFASGGLLGTAVGTAVAILWAPQSGDELRGRIADRVRRARLAGAEAKAAKEEQLIHKFRAEVEDPQALRDEEAKTRVEAAQAVAAIGLGLNAPGALAAQETALRAGGADPVDVDDGIGGMARTGVASATPPGRPSTG